MAGTQPLHPVPASDFTSDPRLLLVERILSTGPFQKSAHLPALLSYLADRSIRGRHEFLTERQIGMAVFGKPTGYSPAEDSVVRVNIRHLRLRLHEYFACEGRGESLVIDIPKGSYALEFRTNLVESKPLADSSPPLSFPRENTRRLSFRDALSIIAAIIALICAFGWRHAATAGSNASVPWPLNCVIQKDHQTKVVVADSNSMLRLLGDKELSLEQYLQPGYFQSMFPAHPEQNVSRLLNYISDSQLTSFSDVVVSSTLVRLSRSSAGRLAICTARDLNRRDLEQGNYVFVGGPTSNPWVSLFEDKLNFKVVEDGVGGTMYFLNKTPKSGEQPVYQGLKHTGSTGEDYATISLLPTGSGQGNVLILQGLRQEGTEALGVLLADDSDRQQLKRALGMNSDSGSSPYFEALIRARAVAGAPVSINIVATRTIHP